MRKLLAFFILLLIDQITRCHYQDSVWYAINPGFFDQKLQIVYGTILAGVMLLIGYKYNKLYGERVWFSNFLILILACGSSTILDLAIFGGGRDFIPIGDYYIANLGDIYFALAFGCLAIELITNKRGRLRDFWISK